MLERNSWVNPVNTPMQSEAVFEPSLPSNPNVFCENNPAVTLSFHPNIACVFQIRLQALASDTSAQTHTHTLSGWPLVSKHVFLYSAL